GTAEMAAFAELGSLISHLPDYPLRDLVFAAHILRPEPPFLFGEIHHDGAGFENADRCAATLRVVVDQYRHAVVGIDLQKVGLELVAPPDIAGDEIVIETQFFEQNGDLFPVGRRPKMQIEHRELLSDW